MDSTKLWSCIWFWYQIQNTSVSNSFFMCSTIWICGVFVCLLEFIIICFLFAIIVALFEYKLYACEIYKVFHFFLYILSAHSIISNRYVYILIASFARNVCLFLNPLIFCMMPKRFVRFYRAHSTGFVFIWKIIYNCLRYYMGVGRCWSARYTIWLQFGNFFFSWNLLIVFCVCYWTWSI